MRFVDFRKCEGFRTPAHDDGATHSGAGVRKPSREACSAFTRVAACTLARSPYFVTRYPKASDISSPPCLLRLLPAGAVAGWDLHPREKRRLVTAHTRTGRMTPDHESGVRNSNLFGRAIEFNRKLDGSSLLRSVGRGAESSHQDCARAQLRWPVFLNFQLSQSRSPDAAIPACAKKESYPLRDMGADLGLKRL